MTRSILFALLALLPVAAPAAAAGPARLSDAELARQRGGFMTPLGLDIGFGATVKTFVDGQLALETRLTWTDRGPLTERSGALAQGAAASDAGWTATLAGRGGETRILQDLSNGRIASVVTNTANDRDIRQETEITLTLPQLPALQQQFAAARTALSLHDAATTALRDGAAR